MILIIIMFINLMEFVDLELVLIVHVMNDDNDSDDFDSLCYE